MAYDRYDRATHRDERSRWPTTATERSAWPRRKRDRGDATSAASSSAPATRVASWFGDDDAERRRREDQMRDDREQHGAASFSDDRDDSRDRDWNRDRDRDRSWFEHSRPQRARRLRASATIIRRGVRELSARSRRTADRGDRGRDYRPMTGDYGRSGSEHVLTAGAIAPIRRGAATNIATTSRAGTSDRSDRSRHERPALQQLARAPHERARPRL